MPGSPTKNRKKKKKKGAANDPHYSPAVAQISSPASPKASFAARRIRRLVLQLEERVTEWRQAESKGAAALTSAVNIMQRLPLIAKAQSRPAMLGVLTRFEGAGELLQLRHLQQLEQSMSYLPRIATELGNCTDRACALSTDASDTLEDEALEGSGANHAGDGARLGLGAEGPQGPAAAQWPPQWRHAETVAWMEDICTMLALELERKQALISRLQYDATAERIADASDLAAEPGAADGDHAEESLKLQQRQHHLSPPQVLLQWQQGTHVDSDFVNECFIRLHSTA